MKEYLPYIFGIVLVIGILVYKYLTITDAVLRAWDIQQLDWHEPSLAKHKLFAAYANGEITHQELVAEIAKIRPPTLRQRLWHGIRRTSGKIV